VTAASRARFSEVVRAEPVDVGLACLLMGAEVHPDLDVDEPLAALDRLAEQVAPLLHLGAAQALRVGLGERAGFGGSAADYEDLRSSLLHQVLPRRRGLPILLSVVWCEVAARLGVPAVPLGLPGHVLVCVGDPEDEHDVVDPFAGGALVDVPATPVLPPVDLLLRVLTNIRALTARQARSLETARTRLWATELSLMLPRHPLALRQERAELLVRLGDFVGGAEALEDYALAVEDADEQVADKARRQARLARARLN
jgi:regulator of sirC expression with transglutaminase-like and TPR domain